MINNQLSFCLTFCSIIKYLQAHRQHYNQCYVWGFFTFEDFIHIWGFYTHFGAFIRLRLYTHFGAFIHFKLLYVWGLIRFKKMRRKLVVLRFYNNHRDKKHIHITFLLHQKREDSSLSWVVHEKHARGSHFKTFCWLRLSVSLITVLCLIKRG